MADVDELYAAAPEDFVAARNALARRLKADGDKVAAAEVAQLRRPSAGAWALNQVARAQPEVIEAALVAGAALRAASDAATSGDAGALREATAAERASGQAVVKAARSHLRERTDALAPALLATLRAAALDDDVAAQLRAGTLTTEHEQAGFGFGLGATDGPVAPRRPARRKEKGSAARPELAAVAGSPDDDPEAKAREQAERAEAKAAERQRKKDHTAAVGNADRLERAATRLAKEAAALELEAAEARERAQGAMAKAAEARRAAEDLA